MAAGAPAQFRESIRPEDRSVAGQTASGLLVVNALYAAHFVVSQQRPLVLAAVDLIYVPTGRISKMYLVDAAVEPGWILAWRRMDVSLTALDGPP